jgi:hypothetical protein
MVTSEDYSQTSTSAVQQSKKESSWSPSPMTPEPADKEQATKDLIAFTEYTFGRYGTAPHYPSADWGSNWNASQRD